jgi:acyl-CoA thioester hydrolase
MQPVETRFRVRYAETDQMGIVYHANYIVWMEIGRVEYCRSAGINYRDMESEGVLLVVVEADCRYASPAHFDDEIVIRTSLAQANPRMVRFEYEINDASGRRLASGATKHIFCTPDHKPVKLPVKYRKAFGMPATDSNGAARSPE